MMQIKTVPSVEALYIHIPFCMKKCNYCDFLSFPHNHDTGESMELYISALINEMELVKKQFSISAKRPPLRPRLHRLGHGRHRFLGRPRL